MERVECQVCGERVGKGPFGLGIKRHSKMHREEFMERYGRWPEDYEEVVELLGTMVYRPPRENGQRTLAEF